VSWKDKLPSDKRYFETHNGILYNGDCLEVMQSLIDNGVQVDAVITEPPYGTTACKWDSIVPLDRMWEKLDNVARKDAAIIMTASQPFTAVLIHSNIKKFKHHWIWDKVIPSGFQIAKYRPMMRHEDIVVFGTSKTIYNRQMEPRDKPVHSRVHASSESSPLQYNDGKVRTYTHKNPQSILVFNKRADGKIFIQHKNR